MNEVPYMKKYIMFAIFSLLALFIISIGPVYAQAADAETNWSWITSDDRYGKFYAPERVRVVARQNGVPTCIEAWIKTAYTAAGAAETIPSMGLSKEIPNSSDLNYSLALIRINPQGRTLEYLEEIFYNKNGTVLASHWYDKPRLKEINSQSFDENFYDAIVDQVFNQGETARAKAADRWITLWRKVDAAAATSATADTTTIRKTGNDVFVWIWQENRNNSGGSIIDIKFYKKVFNLSSYSYKITSYSEWTPADGWKSNNASLSGNYMSIIPDSKEDMEFRMLKQYTDNQPNWVDRYQIGTASQSAASVSNNANTL